MTSVKLRGAQRKNIVPMLLTLALLLLLVVIAVMAGLLLLSQVRAALFGDSSFPGLPGGTVSQNVEYRFGNPLPVWTSEDTVTVLLLGIDQRRDEPGPWRTDTMMLLTLDPKTMRAGVLSIPRDLWVPIPGYGDGRINTAHVQGELYNHPGGGPALARETVEYNLGIPINYHVRVNFDAFEKLVDMIGGIDIYVEETINDPLYPDHHYGYDPLYIEAGWQHFNGELALKYARTRHGNSDFDRARRQQQVLLAVLERVTSLQLLPQIAGRSSEIYQMFQDSVETNLAMDQILALAGVAIKVERPNIRFAVIDRQATQNWVTPQGAQVLIPLREEIRRLRDYILWTDGVIADVPLQQAPPEAATIAVLNGTSRAGLAGSTAAYLQGLDIPVSAYANADRDSYGASQIILNRDTPVRAAQLLNVLGLPPTALLRGSEANAAYDIVIILGADYIGPPAP